MMEDNFLCPICLETLESPIRILHCGHNYCEKCLIDLVKTSHVCPKCREEFPFRNVNDVTRNRELEQVIERGKKEKREETKSFTSQLEENALTLMKEEKYDDAIKIWDAILVKVVLENQKLVPTIHKARCFVSLLRKNDALMECNKIVSIIASSHGEKYNFSDTRDKCDNGMESLIDDILVFDMHERTLLSSISQRLPPWAARWLIRITSNQGNPMVDLIFSLIRQRFQFLKLFYSDDKITLLLKLRDCGRQMEKMFRKVAKQNKKRYLRRQLWIMEDILEIILNTDDVDLTLKFVNVASFHEHFARCYYKIGDYNEALTSCDKAIVILKAAFATRASQYKVLSKCHECIGRALRRLGEKEKASVAFKEAFDLIDVAEDWNDELEQLEFKTAFTKKLPTSERQIQLPEIDNHSFNNLSFHERFWNEL